MTITNEQVKRLRQMIHKNNQEISAAKSGMSTKTARKYLTIGKLPSELKKKRSWKTRTNVFDSVWEEVEVMLTRAPGLQSKTILSHFIKKDPNKFNEGHIRTLQRLLRKWRASNGSNDNIIFNQTIRPGVQSQSDYTSMNELGIRIRGDKFDHLLFHFILPYSRWEYVSICYSESFDSLSKGYEEAVWLLGYVAPEHRTDNLTAASKKSGNKRIESDKWQEFMRHYQVKASRNNPGESHENGSIEKSHDLLKNDIRQELMLRGSSDFLDIEEYQKFLLMIVKRRNSTRNSKLTQELSLLNPLPINKYYAPELLEVTVSKSSTIRVKQVTYSVPSRLIGYSLRVHIYQGEIKLYYGDQVVQKMPEVDKSESSAVINYRHIIGGLLRKPGAFQHYHYREFLFPTVHFRNAYDKLIKTYPVNGVKEYLKILHHAAIDSESEVAAALEILIDENITPTLNGVKDILDSKVKKELSVEVKEPLMEQYDSLLKYIA